MLKKEAINAYENTIQMAEKMDIPMYFRQMQEEDSKELYDIEIDIFRPPWTPWSENGFITSVKAGYNCWLMCEDQTRKIAGYFILKTAMDESHLLTIGLRRDLQGFGYGRKLLDCAIQTAKVHGNVTMLLEVRPSNVGAFKMYKKYGFKEIGLRKKYYLNLDGQREDAIVMRKSLI